MFYSVWHFYQAEYHCVAIYSNEEEARKFATEVPWCSHPGEKPAPVLKHPNVDALISRLLEERLGVLADSLLRLESFANTLPKIEPKRAPHFRP
jgi:hypothetical protein